MFPKYSAKERIVKIRSFLSKILAINFVVLFCCYNIASSTDVDLSQTQDNIENTSICVLQDADEISIYLFGVEDIVNKVTNIELNAHYPEVAEQYTKYPVNLQLTISDSASNSITRYVLLPFPVVKKENGTLVGEIVNYSGNNYINIKYRLANVSKEDRNNHYEGMLEFVKKGIPEERQKYVFYPEEINQSFVDENNELIMLPTGTVDEEHIKGTIDPTWNSELAENEEKNFYQILNKCQINTDKSGSYVIVANKIMSKISNDGQKASKDIFVGDLITKVGVERIDEDTYLYYAQIGFIFPQDNGSQEKANWGIIQNESKNPPGKIITNMKAHKEVLFAITYVDWINMLKRAGKERGYEFNALFNYGLQDALIDISQQSIKDFPSIVAVSVRRYRTEGQRFWKEHKEKKEQETIKTNQEKQKIEQKTPEKVKVQSLFIDSGKIYVGMNYATLNKMIPQENKVHVGKYGARYKDIVTTHEDSNGNGEIITFQVSQNEGIVTDIEIILSGK